MKKFTTKQLRKKANEIRKDVIKMIHEAGSGHPAGSLGMAEIFTALYFQVMRDEDRLFLSHGHVCPAWYAALAHAGYLPRKELMTLRKLGSRLQGHPHCHSLSEIINPSGPLGQGLSQAVGYAYAGQMDGKKFETFCLMSDGEHDEGQTWEAYMFAAKYRVNNITAIIDRNNIQIDGFTEEVMPLEPFREKIEAFGWHAIEIDGHNMGAIIDACAEAKSIFEKPVAIIAHTVPGKGVSFMENKYEWHGRAPNKDEARIILRELRYLSSCVRDDNNLSS